MDEPITLSVLLKKHCRDQVTVAKVQHLASELGLKPTAAGRASLSFRASKETFAQLFQTKPRELSPQPSSSTDFGSRGGYESDDLPIPNVLQDFVESIAIPPPATRMKNSIS